MTFHIEPALVDAEAGQVKLKIALSMRTSVYKTQTACGAQPQGTKETARTQKLNKFACEKPTRRQYAQLPQRR